MPRQNIRVGGRNRPVRVPAPTSGARRPLAASDFALSRLRTIDGHQSNLAFSAGLTHRYVGTSLRFLTLSLLSNDGYLDLVEFDPALPNTAPQTTQVHDTGQTWGAFGPTLQNSGHYGLWFEGDGTTTGAGRLWTTSAFDYPDDSGTSLTRSILIRTMAADGTLGTPRGQYGMQGIGQRASCGNPGRVPDAWAAANGLPTPCYSVADGGYASRIAQGLGPSLGLCLAAIPDPTTLGLAGDGTPGVDVVIPTSSCKLLADHRSGSVSPDWYAAGHPTTVNRGWRLPGSPPVLNYYDGGDLRPNPTTPPTLPPDPGGQWQSPAPDGHSYYAWGDACHGTQCWIDGPSRSGYASVFTGASGKAFYRSSNLNCDGLSYQIHCFDPADFARAIAGTLDPCLVQPSSMADVTAALDPRQPVPVYGSPGGIMGATFDAATRKLHCWIPNYDGNYGCLLAEFDVDC